MPPLWEGRGQAPFLTCSFHLVARLPVRIRKGHKEAQELGAVLE